jgi:hypothetical protein
MSFTETELRQLAVSDAAERKPIRWGQAGRGLGRLAYDEVVALHGKPGVGQGYIAHACGVNQCSVSRWQAANGFVQVWVKREWLNHVPR